MEDNIKKVLQRVKLTPKEKKCNWKGKIKKKNVNNQLRKSNIENQEFRRREKMKQKKNTGSFPKWKDMDSMIKGAH